MNITALRLRSLREKKGLSQRDVAQMIGITRAAYNKYECGVSRPVRVSPEMGKTDKKAFVKLLSGFGGVNGALLFRKGGAVC